MQLKYALTQYRVVLLASH